MAERTPDATKAFLLEAFDTLFNRRDYEAAVRFWSADYIQHSAHIPPGRLATSHTRPGAGSGPEGRR